MLVFVFFCESFGIYWNFWACDGANDTVGMLARGSESRVAARLASDSFPGAERANGCEAISDMQRGASKEVQSEGVACGARSGSNLR